MRQLIFLSGLCLSLAAQPSSGIFYATTKDPLDVVIPSTTKDLFTLDRCIEGIKRHGKNIRRVIVISSQPLSSLAEWFDESYFPFTKASIAHQIFRNDTQETKYSINPRNRLGWKFQQLLKLYAAYVIPGLSPNILILDSDTIFLKDIEFLDGDANAIFNVGLEYHVPYFEHMARLHPSLSKVFEEHSGISHHMVFQKVILDDLFNTIKEHHGIEPWKAICNMIDKDQLLGSSFSEFEIYFNFVFSRTDQMKLRNLKMLNTGECADTDKYRREGFDYISCHAFLRTE